VYAIDPGALADNMPPNVEHMCMKGEEAVHKFIADGTRLNMYMCDMNAAPKFAFMVSALHNLDCSAVVAVAKP